MYLRHTTIRKKGKTHTYWRLVRSVRRGRKVVQETVAHLGELDAQGRARARRLAFEVTGRHEQYELFEEPAGDVVPVCGLMRSSLNGRGGLALFECDLRGFYVADAWMTGFLRKRMPGHCEGGHFSTWK